MTKKSRHPLLVALAFLFAFVGMLWVWLYFKTESEGIKNLIYAVNSFLFLGLSVFWYFYEQLNEKFKPTKK